MCSSDLKETGNVEKRSGKQRKVKWKEKRRMGKLKKGWQSKISMQIYFQKEFALIMKYPVKKIWTNCKM